MKSNDVVDGYLFYLNNAIEETKVSQARLRGVTERLATLSNPGFTGNFGRGWESGRKFFSDGMTRWNWPSEISDAVSAEIRRVQAELVVVNR